MGEPSEIFTKLDRLEKKILDNREGKPPLPPLGRPFQRPLEPLEGDVTKKIKFPSKDEKFGWVYFAWRLPGILKDNTERLTASSILATYLTSTAVSPLQKRFVEIAEPLGNVKKLCIINTSYIDFLIKHCVYFYFLF